jgi:pSer/pThr/pTyr-binding forkhead associated (FHA) protein
MGRIIRRTVTITITENWTIVWSDEARADDTAQPQNPLMLQDQSKPQEEQDETILPAVTTGAATDAQPGDVSPKSVRQRKRTPRGRAVG